MMKFGCFIQILKPACTIIMYYVDWNYLDMYQILLENISV